MDDNGVDEEVVVPSPAKPERVRPKPKELFGNDVCMCKELGARQVDVDRGKRLPVDQDFMRQTINIRDLILDEARTERSGGDVECVLRRFGALKSKIRVDAAFVFAKVLVELKNLKICARVGHYLLLRQRLDRPHLLVSPRAAHIISATGQMGQFDVGTETLDPVSDTTGDDHPIGGWKGA